MTASCTARTAWPGIPRASIAERPRCLHMVAGLSQYELARRVGVTLNLVSFWELGRFRPSRRSRRRLLAVLGVEYLPPGDPALVPKPDKPKRPRGRQQKG